MFHKVILSQWLLYNVTTSQCSLYPGGKQVGSAPPTRGADRRGEGVRGEEQLEFHRDVGLGLHQRGDRLPQHPHRWKWLPQCLFAEHCLPCLLITHDFYYHTVWEWLLMKYFGAELHHFCLTSFTDMHSYEMNPLESKADIFYLASQKSTGSCPKSLRCPLARRTWSAPPTWRRSMSSPLSTLRLSGGSAAAHNRCRMASKGPFRQVL